MELTEASSQRNLIQQEANIFTKVQMDFVGRGGISGKGGLDVRGTTVSSKEKTRTFAKDAYDVMEQIETIEPEPSRDPNRPVLPAAGQMRAVYVADMS